MKSRKLPTWDLSSLFNDMEDPRIKRILVAFEKRAKDFSRRYRGKIAQITRNKGKFIQLFKDFEELHQEAAKPILYAQLFFSESSKDPARGAFLQQMKSWHTGIEKELMFFELELLALKTSELTHLINSSELRAYKNFLRQLLNTKAHRLSEKEEHILSDKALSGREAFTRLFDQELARKEFSIKKKDKTVLLSESEVLSMLYSPSRSERKIASEGLTQGLQQEAHRLTYIFNTLAQDKALEDSIRHFEYPEQSRHIANQISAEMVEAMTSVVISNYKVVQDFYGFKKGLLGLNEIFDYDRYAPVLRKEKQYSFKDARALVLNAFYGFSDEYGRIAEEFFVRNWIDAAKRPGKRSGAFCSFVTPDLHPYVFINYNGNLRDIFTLAHELGHGIHAYLMRCQNYLNFDVALTVAETASVFAEMLLFDHLAAKLGSKEELLSIYVGKLESIFATVFRQISLYRFEQELHRARRAEGELLTARVNTIWRKTQVEMFGKAVTLTSNYDYWWSYIPHFIHSPFYVYAYAYGELLTLALYARYKTDGAKFVGRYMDCLSKGSSVSPTELLKPFGVNMKDKKFWGDGVHIIKQMVSKTRSLA